jgi:hypothetical protein
MLYIWGWTWLTSSFLTDEDDGGDDDDDDDDDERTITINVLLLFSFIFRKSLLLNSRFSLR